MSIRIRMPSGSPSCSTNWLCDLGYRFALSERVVWDKHPWWVCCLETVRPRSCLVNAGSVSIRRGEEELSWGPGWVWPGQDKRQRTFSHSAPVIGQLPSARHHSRPWVPQTELCSYDTNSVVRGMLKRQIK